MNQFVSGIDQGWGRERFRFGRYTYEQYVPDGYRTKNYYLSSHESDTSVFVAAIGLNFCALFKIPNWTVI